MKTEIINYGIRYAIFRINIHYNVIQRYNYGENAKTYDRNIIMYVTTHVHASHPLSTCSIFIIIHRQRHKINVSIAEIDNKFYIITVNR